MLVIRKSPFTGIVNEMEIPNASHEQMGRFNRGEDLIQNIFPKCNADEREFIKTGITAEEWEKMFGDDEEEEQSGRSALENINREGI